MAKNDNNIEDAFGKSLKNKFSEQSNYDSGIEAVALNEARKLNKYMMTDKSEKTGHRTLIINTLKGDLKFQSTEIKFIRSNGEVCKAEFSIPIEFVGPIRIWTADFRGKKVWSTMRKIKEYQCNPDLLFDFLGKYTHRFTQKEFEDDLPF